MFILNIIHIIIYTKLQLASKLNKYLRVENIHLEMKVKLIRIYIYIYIYIHIYTYIYTYIYIYIYSYINPFCINSSFVTYLSESLDFTILYISLNLI